MISSIFRFSREDLNEKFSDYDNSDKIVEAAFKLAYGNTNWKWSHPVQNQGALNVWSSGTDGDVTLLCWLHEDGNITVQAVTW